MSRQEFSEGDDPTMVIRRRTIDELPRSMREWVKLDQYPSFDEWIRGCEVMQTKPPYRLAYLVLAKNQRLVTWPAVVAIRNERRIRFGDDYIMRFGLTDEGGRVVSVCKEEDFPDFRNADVVLSNPDFVRMTQDWSK